MRGSPIAGHRAVAGVVVWRLRWPVPVVSAPDFGVSSSQTRAQAYGVATMSLIDLSQLGPLSQPGPLEPGQIPAPRPAQDPGVPDGAAGRPPRPAMYALVYNDPDNPAAGHPVGWVLTARHDTSWYWSTSLAARGAGAHAGTRVAQAVAVRVLHEQGVAVESWTGPTPGNEPGDPPGAPASFRARLASPPHTAAQPPSVEPGRLRRALSGQLHGH